MYVHLLVRFSGYALSACFAEYGVPGIQKARVLHAVPYNAEQKAVL